MRRICLKPEFAEIPDDIGYIQDYLTARAPAHHSRSPIEHATLWSECRRQQRAFWMTQLSCELQERRNH